MANGMMNDPNASMGGQPPMGEPMGNPMGAEAPMMGGREDAVLDMHLTQDVKQALQSKGIDVSAVADRGPKEPVVVIPVSIIMNKYQGASPEESMKQFVQDMTANAQAPATEPMPQPAMAEAPPSPEGLGAPTMDRPPMTA
jgi:pyruvate/2-oxoglutarate dehydrogenase complex dihydrolipoamide acyltransferase (E2) component